MSHFSSLKIIFIAVFASLAISATVSAQHGHHGHHGHPTDCDIYPIAISQHTLEGAQIGQRFNHVHNGIGNHEFGWLTWSGHSSSRKLAKSLTPHGNSDTYCNPDDFTDHQLDIGDWVRAQTHVHNSRRMRRALHRLKHEGIIVVPVWDQVRCPGHHVDYRVVAFAKIRLLSYNLHHKKIAFRFMGYEACSVENLAPVVNAGGDASVFTFEPLVLNGSVQDDGFPAGSSLTATWTQLSGPGAATFVDPSDVCTAVSFDQPGVYVLRLTGDDGELSTSDELSVTVGQNNEPPTAENGAFTLDEDTSVAATLAVSDPDGDSLTYTIVVSPNFGVISGSAPNLIYTPAADYYGPDHFEYKVSDGELESVVATVSLTVVPVNDAPVAEDENLTTVEDLLLAISIGGSDVDGDTTTVEIVDQPANGLLDNLNPVEAGLELEYTPAPNFSGQDSFTYRVTDGTLFSEIRTVAITITPVNDA
ncbi:MAG: Ig-like domain-containing protein, partial [Verrucomicrobiales bacterium]|nr:Ig-like domain-containing protein [Verrucomicrobiales bacterium]